jgi:3-oxoacyl-[acyl-carrier-protein] synthase-1
VTARPVQADILAVGLATPVGLDGPSAAAAIRAGICRFKESKIRNKDDKRQILSLVGREYLPDLDPSIPPALGMASVRARMLKLGAFALREACAPCSEPPPLLLALPAERSGPDTVAGPHFVRDLALQARVKLDESGSRVYRQGGAACLFALRDALALLAAERFPYVLIGGVDSFLDLLRLGRLDSEDRLLGSSEDGFIPGEGAAFLLLGSRALRRRLGLDPIVRVTGVGLGTERGHRYSKEPYRGDGLAEAFQALFAPLPPDLPKVRCVYAGFNGESLPTKEWGVAYLRSAERFAERVQVEHPADCIGDAGAALGPIMLALAAIGIRKGYREEPCLLWSTSDGDARAAALLQAAV